MSKESDRQASRWHVSFVLLGTIVIVYVMSVLLIQATTALQFSTDSFNKYDLKALHTNGVQAFSVRYHLKL